MILHALAKYYERLKDDPDRDVPLPGFSDAKISFALHITPSGELVQVEDLRLAKGKKLNPRIMLVPQAVKKTSGISSNFLWDNTGYVLGADDKGKPERSLKTFEAFRAKCAEVAGGVDDPGMKAVLTFMEKWQPAQAEAMIENWEDVCGWNLVFKLDGEKKYVHESPAVQKAWLDYKQQQNDGEPGQCLISGENEPIARLHPVIKGVWGAQTAGANIVSFNLDAFTSYGKKQGLNAPVGESTAFAYTTALNTLLAGDNRIQIGDASTVFWSESPTDTEDMTCLFFKGVEQDQKKQTAEDQAQNVRLKEFLKAVKEGNDYDAGKLDTPFYILGLSPNASRISVRFWHMSTVGKMQKNLAAHLKDMEIVRQYPDSQQEHPPLWLLTKQTAAQGKTENIPPHLAGEMARSIFSGEPYPRILLSLVIGRIRAEQEVRYERAMLIKGYLSRQYRKNSTYRNNPNSMEITVSLDTESRNPAYRLGRLFAVLEKLQSDALGGVNATIRDKYMSSASSAPRSTFPQLLRLAQAHIKKSDWGGKSDREIQGILDEIQEFPATLDMEQQGLFFLGYYQQKTDLYTKKQDKPAE